MNRSIDNKEKIGLKYIVQKLKLSLKLSSNLREQEEIFNYLITTNNVYTCFEFENIKEDNIYMSPELFTYYFNQKNKLIMESKKSNIFSVGLLISQFICNLSDD